MKVWFKDPDWWDKTFDRVLKTAAQFLIAGIMADQAGWFTQWYQIAGTAGTGALLAFLTAIVFDPREGGNVRLFSKTSTQ